MSADFWAFLTTVVTSNAISIFLTKLFDRKKSEIEMRAMEDKLTQNGYEFLKKQFEGVIQSNRDDIANLKADNDRMEKRIKNMNSKLNAVMSWIVTENASNIQFLRNKITEMDPEFEFPEVRPYPNPWSDDED